LSEKAIKGICGILRHDAQNSGPTMANSDALVSFKGLSVVPGGVKSLKFNAFV